MTTLNRDPPNSGGYYVELNQCASPCDQQVSSPYCTYQVSAHNIAQLSVWTHARAGTGSDPIHRLHYDTDVRRCAEDHEMRASQCRLALRCLSLLPREPSASSHLPRSCQPC